MGAVSAIVHEVPTVPATGDYKLCLNRAISEPALEGTIA